MELKNILIGPSFHHQHGRHYQRLLLWQWGPLLSLAHSRGSGVGWICSPVPAEDKPLRVRRSVPFRNVMSTSQRYRSPYWAVVISCIFLPLAYLNCGGATPATVFNWFTSLM